MKQETHSASGTAAAGRDNGLKSVDSAVTEISAQLRSNLATIRSFLHFLEIGQYKATEQELREMHDKLDGHLEMCQANILKKLDKLSELVKAQVSKN